MIHDVVSASYKGEYKIELKFDDGKRGIVDFSRYLNKGGVFDRFKDITFFKQFRINEELGVLTWQDEIDIAPETLYAEATRTSLPNWVENKRKPSANKTIQRTADNRRCQTTQRRRLKANSPGFPAVRGFFLRTLRSDPSRRHF